MHAKLKTPYILSALLTALMVVQSLLGLLFQGEYRDEDWIKATWFGNDWVTLVAAVPLMITALVLARQDSTRSVLLWLGMLGYSIYNYAFYLFGVALNAFFPFFIVALILSVAALILALSHIDSAQVAADFSPGTPRRIVGGYLMFIAVTFFVVWLGMWAAHVFAGRPTPTRDPEAFKLVAALDLTIMMPALGMGGFLLWRRNAWGYLIAAIAAIQGTLYLLVLSVNAALSIARGLQQAPGQLPIWGTLLIATTTAAVVLLASVRASVGRTAGSIPTELHRPAV
jgi:hypothetical protein